MAIFNPDKLRQKKEDCMKALSAALKSNDEAAMASALEDWSETVAQSVTVAAFENSDGVIDASVLASRRVRQLTAHEKKFYQKFIEAAKDPNPKMAIANIAEAMPLTIIDSVLEDIRKEHRILDIIKFQNTTAIRRMVRNKTGKQTGVWGELTDAIKGEISGNIEVVETALYKLTAYMFVAKDLLDLGPVWVDRFVRETLMEVIALSLEIAVVDGTGNKQLIGMTRSVADDVSVTGGVYPRKTAVKLKEFTPTVYGNILKTLAKDRNGRPRKIGAVAMLVNPADYFGKVFPATTVRAADGTYRHDVLPYPTEVIQSEALDEGRAVIGLPEQYWCGVGLGKDAKIEYDDSYKFLEDLRTYAVKLFAVGSANDDNAFVLLDISALKPSNIKVEVVSEPAETETGTP